MPEKHQSVEAALRRAELHAKRGEVGDARQLCSAILAQFPSNKRALKLLAALRAPGPTRPRAANARADLQTELNALIAPHQKGRAQELQQRAAALAVQFPGNPVVHNLLGISLAATGRTDEAIASFTKALAVDPGFFPARTNLGVQLASRGQVEEAVAQHKAALNINPDYAEAHHNLGNCLKRLGRLDEAIQAFQRVLELRPDLVEVRKTLGTIFRSMSRDAEAADQYAQAVELDPNDAHAWNNLGVALNALGRREEAIASYREALRQKPGLREAYTNLCELYEKTNRLDDLRREVALGQDSLGDGDPYQHYWLAVIASKEHKYPEARDHLEAIAPDQLTLKVRLKRSELLGKIYDRLNQPDQAFPQFAETNRLAAEWQAAHAFDQTGYVDELRCMEQSWSEAPRTDWVVPATAGAPVSLAFLVGFPRSGTTLLETMLRGHPRIAALEEKPTIERVGAALGCPPTFAALNALDPDDILRLRSVYLEEVTQSGAVPSDQLLVDKLPLNIAKAGLIHRVFPEAKFIFALRHPCDCVLSCFIQNFRLNDAMANFLDLNRAAELYDLVMRLWQAYRTTLRPDCIRVRYEELVVDPKSQIEPLLGFLGLDWHDDVLDHRGTAESRGRINTPSYNQVTQDLYTHASGRWENYRAQMAAVLPVLGPWAAEWGYPVSDGTNNATVTRPFAPEPRHLDPLHDRE